MLTHWHSVNMDSPAPVVIGTNPKPEYLKLSGGGIKRPQIRVNECSLAKGQWFEVRR